MNEGLQPQQQDGERTLVWYGPATTSRRKSQRPANNPARISLIHQFRFPRRQYEKAKRRRENWTITRYP
jgi:hypothetical protein